jgi:enamine deaminase RidA (YjgF/YER057c/UK114 family)
MKRQNMIVIALSTLAVAGAAVPFTPANAQSGDALAQAERTCMNNGLHPSTTVFDTCVSRSAFDYDRGQPEMAARDAVMVRDANDVCQSYGIAPMTLGYRQCVGDQIEKSTIAGYNIRYDVPLDEGPHATVAIDGFGFRYDAEGNVLDQDGFVIRAVP